LNLNTRSRNIKSIGVSLPLYSVNVIKRLAMSCTNLKWGGAMLTASSTLHPSRTKRSTSACRSCVDQYNTNMRAMIKIADCLGVYTNASNHLLSGLIPNTAMLLINTLLYSLSPKT
jgi:hypothetical protein